MAQEPTRTRQYVGIAYLTEVMPLERTPMLDRITHDPQVLAGRATLRGLRISVAHVVNLVANGMTTAEIIAEHPDLDEEDVRQALTYAAAIAEDQVYPIPAGK